MCSSSAPERARGTAAVTTVYVDAMNVLGSRPDGWWRDRDAAVRRLVGELQPWAATGGRRVVVVVDGHERSPLHAGRHGAVDVVYADRPGPDAADDRIVELVEADRAASTSVEVVTADRALRARVAALDAVVRGPRSLLDELAGLQG